MVTPLISIIITVLNGEKTINQTLFSISNQIFADFELIIIDGGSQDKTVQIVNESNSSNRIVHIYPGMGLYAGLNEGINLSRGKWLYFMGADDELYDPTTLQKVAEVIKALEVNIKVIVGKVECVKQAYVLEPAFGSPYMMKHQVHHQGMFYNRHIFDGLKYNENMKIASDYELNMKLALDKVPHQVMNLTICNFGGDGISENQLSRGYLEMQEAHKRLFQGFSRYWVINYFWLRRSTGAMLRRYNLLKLRTTLRKVFG